MSDVGANIFAERGGCTRVCCSVVNPNASNQQITTKLLTVSYASVAFLAIRNYILLGLVPVPFCSIITSSSSLHFSLSAKRCCPQHERIENSLL